MQFELSVDLRSITPWGTSAQLPVSDRHGWLVHIVNCEGKRVKDKQNGYLEFELEITDGEHKGTSGFWRINLWNDNETAARIAYQQLATLALATGIMPAPGRIDPAIWFGKPFRAVIGLQKKQNAEDPDYTEVKNLFTANGERVTKAAASAASPSAAPPALAAAINQAVGQTPQPPGFVAPGQQPQGFAPPAPQAPQGFALPNQAAPSFGMPGSASPNFG